FERFSIRPGRESADAIEHQRSLVRQRLSGGVGKDGRLAARRIDGGREIGDRLERLGRLALRLEHLPQDVLRRAISRARRRQRYRGSRGLRASNENKQRERDEEDENPWHERLPSGQSL